MNELQKSILVDRINIGIFGRTNAGKSTIMNRITNQETSIVDKQPGTTADTVRVLFEIHGFGPVRLFDTAGLDEESPLGKKKREKTIAALKECDLVLIAIDPEKLAAAGEATVENELLSLANKYEKQTMIIFNLFNKTQNQQEAINKCKKMLFQAEKYPVLVINVNKKTAGKELVAFITQNFKKVEKRTEILPFLKPYSFVALNIPIDEETPERRLLRPQNVVLDYLLRRMVPFAGYRMDLKKARSEIESIREQEKRNYLNFIEELNGTKIGLQLVITDSQAIDVVASWTPKHIPITTFSITMINAQCHGNLKLFVKGLEAVKMLKPGDKVIIAEACNHDRKCDDIGTKQIPRRLTQKLGFNLDFKFVFGREYFSNELLSGCKLLIHCGGCMVDSQKIGARMQDLSDLGVPVTNYGLILSYIDGEKTLRRVLKPWGL